MKIRPVGAGWTDVGRTDGHEEANSRFSQFLWTRLKSV